MVLSVCDYLLTFWYNKTFGLIWIEKKKRKINSKVKSLCYSSYFISFDIHGAHVTLGGDNVAEDKAFLLVGHPDHLFAIEGLRLVLALLLQGYEQVFARIGILAWFLLMLRHGGWRESRNSRLTRRISRDFLQGNKISLWNILKEKKIIKST